MLSEQPPQANLSARPALWGGQFPAARLGEFLAAWQLDQRDMPWRLWEWVSEIILAHTDDQRTQAQAAPDPTNLDWLERGRAFGEGGDLSVRRDGDCVYWRFIGAADATLPDGFVPDAQRRDSALASPCAPADVASDAPAPPFRAADFWASEFPGREPDQWQAPDFAEWQRVTRHGLLWGQERRAPDVEPNGDRKGTGVWREDRVAGVRTALAYPKMSRRYGRDENEAGRVALEYDEYLNADTVEAIWWRGLTHWVNRGGR